MSRDVFALNLRHLRAVLAVARLGSVSAAASEINLSQPALTQGLAQLERQLGQPLFDRRPDGMTATPAGGILAARMEASAQHLAEAMRHIRRGAAGGFMRPDRLITMVQVRALIALRKEGGFVSAANATGLSQPALHRAVRDVERLCGVMLVERRGRGVAMTEAGLRLARAFRLAIGEIAAAIADMQALDGTDGGRIAIGAMPLARARLLPTAVADFHRAFPGVALDIAEGSHSELIEPLRDGELDILVGALRDPAPGADVEQVPLFTDRLAVFARAGHPLREAGQPSIATLAAYPWLIARAGTPLRGHWEALFTTAGMPVPQVMIECGSVMMLRGLLLEGDFLTLLSPDQVALEVEAGMLAMVGAPLTDTRRVIGLTTRTGWRPTASQARFIDLLKARSADYILPETE
ncbi:LysR family transcriptional regulator [Sphingobium algorifonticola]|uniref:LysR family transcriptional regulator n=1 Tax=Sphingobium algorifonticola TaxID=2008318 RepID=A0A437J5C6_9SPHN|nr:LysR family transcriptional regulator [Sphingobium algorifonticola]RVT40125.1 LysR family transcriptional regulator [Sphingobium algorifonticola]